MKTATDTDCVFHADRFAFDALVREMRRAKLLSSGHASVMAMAVCTCRKKASYRQPLCEREVVEASDHVTSSLTDDSYTFSASSHDLITSATHIAQRQPMTSSQARLTVIISQALRNDMKLLEEEKQDSLTSRSGQRQIPTSNNDDKNNSTADAKSPKKQKLSMDRIHRIINKKKRKSPVKAKVDLPIFGGLSGELFSDPEIGPGFCRLCVRHACVVELDWEATRWMMDTNKQTTVVKVWCMSLEAVERVRKELIPVAQGIQHANTNMWHKTNDERRMIRQLRTCDVMTDWPTKGASTGYKPHNPLEWKDILSRDFEKQLTKQRICSSVKKPVKRDDGSTYVDGHCLHCLMPFHHFRKNGATGRCHHHPGYVITSDGKYKWTCCGETVQTSHPTHTDHVYNSCQESIHSWRPHKRASRGSGQKSERYKNNLKALM